MYIAKIRLFHYVLCDVSLFGGFSYDDSKQSAHFFADYLNKVCDIFLKLKIEGYGDFENKKELLKESEIIFKFINSIDYENNYWERIFILFINLTEFLNEFGYDYQYMQQSRVADLRSRIGFLRSAENFRRIKERISQKRGVSYNILEMFVE